MPRAIITGVILTIVVYLFVNVGFLCALTVEDIKSSSLIAETFAFELAGIRIISIWILYEILETKFIISYFWQCSSSTFNLALLFIGPTLATPLSLLVFLSLFGSFLGSSLFAGRWCFAASREDHLPRYLKEKNVTKFI